MPSEPKDPVIKALFERHTWDASLSGAAAGLALQAVRSEVSLTSWQVREAVFRAGYPYPVREVRSWSTPIGAEVPPRLLAWLESIGTDEDVGMVRARGATGDTWIGLRALPRVNIDVQPRQIATGGNLVIPAIPGGSFTVADAEGVLRQGSLNVEQRFVLNALGEWLFRVSDANGTAALFPVYVGMLPPDLALFSGIEGSQGTPEEIMDFSSDILANVRDIYGLNAWTRDPLLDAAARAMLSGAATDPAAVATRLGYDPETFARWECRGNSVENCLDDVLWDPNSRPALVGATEYIGLAAELEQAAVHLVILIAPEDS